MFNRKIIRLYTNPRQYKRMRTYFVGFSSIHKKFFIVPQYIESNY